MTAGLLLLALLPGAAPPAPITTLGSAARKGDDCDLK